MDIRKNIYTLTDTQLARFQTALNAIKNDGTYDGFIERHHHSMMTATLLPGETGDANLRNSAHRGPAFAPWHRYFCREMELALQAKEPSVTLPYWDWAADSAIGTGAPIWNADANAGRIYMGGDGTGANNTVTTGPFAGWTALVESAHGGFVPRPGGLHRWLGRDTVSLPTPDDVNDCLSNYPLYDTAPWRTASAGSFRNQLEGWPNGPKMHNRVHVWVGGDMGPGTSPNDPVFFLHHNNIDRIWATWQHRYGNPYLPTAGGPVGHNLNDTMQHLQSPTPTPANSLDYRRNLGYIYDTDPPLADIATGHIAFDDVATLETTWRAAVFHVRSASPITFEVVPGGSPAAPYSLTPQGGSVTHIPPVDRAPYDEVRVWFAFTGEPAAGPAPTGAAQIRCVQTGEIFEIVLTGSTVARPTTGVVFSLDRSGSMSEPAGATGVTRMELMKEAANRCIELVRDGSGVGVVSFDHDPYPGQPLQPFAAADPHRAAVQAAVAGLAPGGATSIGDGVKLARDTLNAGISAFDRGTLVIMTDGLENQPLWLSDVASAIDKRTFAVGLGTAQQVSIGALTALAAGTDGYVLLTAALARDTDSYFLLSKYFQQVLVSATNEDIVTDPSGYISPGEKVRVPFDLTQSDIDATGILFMDVPVLDMLFETPRGELLSGNDLAALGAQTGSGQNMAFGRFGLPLPVGDGAHEGRWHAVLEVNGEAFEKQLSRLFDQRDSRSLGLVRQLQSHGPRYSFSVNTWSNTRMRARVTQTGLQPGALARVSVVLTEYGQPLARPAHVSVQVQPPFGPSTHVGLTESADGTYTASLPLDDPGVYGLRVYTAGITAHHAVFTREQLLSAYTAHRADSPVPPKRDDDREWVQCLLADEGIRKWLEEHGADIEGVRKCVAQRREEAAGMG